MTCIIGIETPEGSLLAGDRYVGAVTHRQRLGYPKLTEVGPVSLGGAGLLRPLDVVSRNFKPDASWTPDDFARCVPELFRELLQEHGCLSSEDGKDITDTSFVMLFKGKVYGLDSYFDLYTVNGSIICIGSGCDFALGALYALPPAITLAQARANAEVALRAASHWSNTVLPPYDYLTQRHDGLG